MQRCQPSVKREQEQNKFQWKESFNEFHAVKYQNNYLIVYYNVAKLQCNWEVYFIQSNIYKATKVVQQGI